MENYVKIEVYNTEKNCTDFWYLDISKISLTNLIKLRQEILKHNSNLDAVLVDIINREADSQYESLKTNRRSNQKMKRPLKSRRRLLNKKRGRY